MSERLISSVDIHTGQEDAWVILPPLPKDIKGKPPIKTKLPNTLKKHVPRDGKK